MQRKGLVRGFQKTPYGSAMGYMPGRGDHTGKEGCLPYSLAETCFTRQGEREASCAACEERLL